MTDHELEQIVLELIPDRERKVAFVIAKVAKAVGDDDEEFLFRVAAVIKRLLTMRVLEAVGDISNWRHSEVRRNTK